MKCSFCGYKFSEKDAKKACQGCVMKNCNMIKCPNCNYENPIDTKLIKNIKRWMKKWK
ncbi:MAG: hypothetical protein QGI38_01910 [Candidatus Woesearchaeota archaeon]|jgi:hypothetical protein|nr:hypothetical protein [Candidatus Woesearchaeota archaeon]|tara:strand:+ start:1260 stop:1433 length:174 start_codon:yes stop_codon:yes gene_type:complete